jgi:two-component system, response regulator
MKELKKRRAGMTSKKIMLVEDNPDDVELTLRALEQSKVTNKIVVAHDGAEACEILFGSEMLKPALILLDLKLPKIDGLELLKKIRGDERTKLLPVVILTSSKEEKDLVKSYSLGANSYIRKPVDFDQFIQAVGELGLYWLLLNELPQL